MSFAFNRRGNLCTSVEDISCAYDVEGETSDDKGQQDGD